MTNPPGWGCHAQTETDLPALSYASVYPVALIFKILIAQFLVEVLRRVPLLLAALLLTSCGLLPTREGPLTPSAYPAPQGEVVSTSASYPAPQDDQQN
jgi:hypothetical protein